MTEDRPTTVDRVITGEQFLAARARARLTNRQLARMLGTSSTTISNWLRDGVPRRAEADVEDKLGLYLRAADDPAQANPLAQFSDVQLLAELWQRMDSYKRTAETTPEWVSDATDAQQAHSDATVTKRSGEDVRRGTAPRRPKPTGNGE